MAQTRPPRTLGPHHDEFWAYCAKDELRVQQCRSCAHLQWPVAARCEQCGSSDFEWRRMSGKATLSSWCAFHHDYYRGTIETPYAVILAKLEEGPLFLSNPVDFDEEDMDIGMRLSVDFIDCVDKAGSFRLPVFRRA